MRTLIAITAILLVGGCANPPNVTTTSYPAFNFFMLEKDMTWEIGNTGVAIVVPAGFVTDLASVPKELWSFGLSPADKYTRAAIVHDYLYWAQSCTKTQSDNLLKIAMTESDVAWIDKSAVFTGVVVGGQGSWDANTLEANQGWPKIVPPAWRNVPPGIEWREHRAAMHIRGVRDVKVAKDLPYCKYGSTTTVPVDSTRPPSTVKRFNKKGVLEDVYVDYKTVYVPTPRR